MDKNIGFFELSNLWLNKSTKGVCYTYGRALESNVNHLNHYLYGKKVKDVKPYDIDFILQSLATYNPNTKKPSSKKFLTQLINTAKRIFDFAVENEIIYKNPAKDKKKEIPRNAPVKEVEEITALQQQLVINFNHRAKIAAVLMMFTGLRTGELMALEWNDIDLDKLVIVVNKRTQKIDTNKWAVSPGTKNGKIRYVSIPSNLGKWLYKQKLMATSYLVVPNRSGELNSPTQWKGLWKNYQKEINYFYYCKNCKEAGITPRNRYHPEGIPQVVSPFNPHQLRHTYATLLYISGVDVLTAKELLGHSNVITTLKIYTHLDEKFKKLNITKFDDYIKKDMNIKDL